MRKTFAGIYLPGDDPDALLLPQVDELAAGELVVRYRSLQDRGFRKELTRDWWRCERGAVGTPSGPGQLMYSLADKWPQFIGAVAPTAVAVTPTGLGTTTARIFPFYPDLGVYVAKAYVHTSGVAAASMDIAVFDNAGAANNQRLWDSGVVATAANITAFTLGAASFLLSPGTTYFFAITNGNSAVATNAYYFSTPFAATGGTPRWGTVAATAGAMPASINPGGITVTVGGFPIYTILSAA